MTVKRPMLWLFSTGLFLIIALVPVKASAQGKVLFQWTESFQVALSYDLPVSKILDSEPEFRDMRLEETIGKDTRSIPFQILKNGHIELCWIARGPVNQGETRQYRLMACSKTVAEPGMGVGILRTDSDYLFVQRGKPVLAYHFSIHPAPAGQSKWYARSGFIHPLYAPSGQVLTWIQPPDHYHHYGIWDPWTRVTWKEHTTDFWNLKEHQGTVRYQDLISMRSGPVCGEIIVRQNHIAFDPQDPENGPEQKVLDETWRIRVWNVRGGFLIDFESILKPAIDEPVSLDVYRYGGGIGYRATKEWTGNNSEVITSEGKTWDNGDATRAKWCRVYGTVNGVTNGVLFLSDQRNYDFPQHMRIWPKKLVGAISYQYFEFCPTREKALVLKPGDQLDQRYRIWVSKGTMTMDEMEAMWEGYNLRQQAEGRE
ncbi:MAG: PmoA family protein [Bacteroidales bacterium]|nr:PmoA family protein [Bacteroidales bacterium]